MYYYIKSLKNYNLLGISINKSISSYIINNICVYIDDNETILKNKFLVKSLFDYADLSYFDINLNIVSTNKHIQTKFGDIYKHININPSINKPHIDNIINLINDINKNNQVLVITSIDNLDCKLLINNITNKKTKIHFMNINFNNKFIDYFVLNCDVEFFIASHMEEIIEYFFTNLSKTYIKINYLDKRLTIKTPDYQDIKKKETLIGILLDKTESDKLLISNSKIKLTINNSVYNIGKRPTELEKDKKIIISLLGILNHCSSKKSHTLYELHNLIDLYITTNNFSNISKYNKKSQDQISRLLDDTYYAISMLNETYRNKNITRFIYDINKNNENSLIIKNIIDYEELIEYRDRLYSKKEKPQSLILQKQVINNIDSSIFNKLKNNINMSISKYNIPSKVIIEDETFYCSIINQSSYHEEIKNGDVLGILINLSYDNPSCCISLDDINIKDISLSFIFFSEILNAQKHFFNKFYNFDDGVDNDNHAISGNGLGRGNAIIPIYIDKPHFSLVKLLYKYILGLGINQDLFSYHKNYYLLPLLVLSKYNVLLFTEFNVNDRALKIWLELYITCKEIYNEYVQYYRYYLTPYTNLDKLVLDDKRMNSIINKYSNHTIFMMYILLFKHTDYDIIKLHIKTLKLYNNKHTPQYIFNFIKIYDIIFNIIKTNEFKEGNISKIKIFLNNNYEDINKYGDTIDEFLKNKYNYINHN